MKQSKIRELTKRNLAQTLSKIDEAKCPVMHRILKEVIGINSENLIVNK